VNIKEWSIYRQRVERIRPVLIANLMPPTIFSPEY